MAAKHRICGFAAPRVVRTGLSFFSQLRAIQADSR
jgi:hypothetical protein